MSLVDTFTTTRWNGSRIYFTNDYEWESPTFGNNMGVYNMENGKIE